MDFQNFKNRYQKKIVREVPNNVVAEPLVSVCVQTYQHVNYIRECLDGILMQRTSFLFEVLLGDDESSDGTREICLEYAEKYPDKIRLFLHHRVNNIKVDSKATGRFNFLYNLYSARGKYLAFCEGDDFWTDPLKLHKQINALEQNKLFSGSFHNTFTKMEKEKKTILDPWRTYSKKVFYFEDTISEYSLLHTSAFVFRKILLDIPEWFTKVQSGDMALFSLIASKGPFLRIDKFMSVYRKNDFSITNNISAEEYHRNRIKMLTYFKSNFSPYSYPQINDVIQLHRQELMSSKRKKFDYISFLLGRKNG